MVYEVEINHERKRKIREKRVEVRLSLTEFELLKDANISNIARFLRDAAFNAVKKEPLKMPFFSKIDRDFVLELSRIGNNINQISRAVNTEIARSEPLNAVKLLHLLIDIQETLRNLRIEASDDH
ncbi:plasmid mobilization relaxosome protein MobC [Acinetobacter terrestris]|uniref:Plasmid mobilization relaxosome protein MobC n=1 Tax=Acinetobacter terrestris TaxID=2529843 RepID=A0AAW6UV14_9GAMM|nr:plasmid mobilization relaxosome protein MobC [Acinetobacter terrestris]MDK1685021.1 plasmid mobilization relaxosome protein MobC [Acinetobacter terrestris]